MIRFNSGIYYCLLLLLGSESVVVTSFQSRPWKQSRAAAASAASRISVAVASITTVAPLSETEECGTVTSSSSSSSETIRFVSPKMQVYIEDTDAYGIMYNGNYLRAYDRALQMASSTNQTKGTLPSRHDDWAIVSFSQQKFRSSPALGQDYVIRGELKQQPQQQTQSSDFEIWDLQMTNPEGDIVYNTISDLKIADLCPRDNTFEDNNSNNRSESDSSVNDEERPEETTNESLLSPAELSDDPFQKIVKSSTNNNGEARYRCFAQTNFVYRDEIDAHGPQKGHLPLRIVLNYFERCRSFALGGADELRRLQVDDGIVVVVTAIRLCSLVHSGVAAGDSLLCETFAVPKRKGMVFECYQTIQHNSKTIARGQVNLMLLDAKSRKPTRNVPQRILEIVIVP